MSPSPSSPPATVSPRRTSRRRRRGCKRPSKPRPGEGCSLGGHHGKCHSLAPTTFHIASATLPSLARTADSPPSPVNRTTTAIAAHYLDAHMYTFVLLHVRAAMEWMAFIGTQYLWVTGKFAIQA